MEAAWEFAKSTGYLQMDALWEFIKKTGYMFYIMNPKQHLYEKIEEVPDYYKEVTPSFMFVIMLEMILRFLKKRPALRINDTITNICQGMLVEIFKIPLQGIELIVYVWIYNNYRVVTLPWDSVWTWLLGMVGSDFVFYWMHRATHQISILWNFHEPHHSSEDYNMTVPLRISILTSSNFWYTSFPLAIAIPPQVFLVHYQLVIIFQFWLHSELLPTLGPLEWIFNTPGFHRVHHGRNRRCIDKNFGSIFIIWDRMFGTFEPETEDDVKYGVTKPIQTFNSFWIQTNYFWPMCQKFLEVKGVKNKLWSLIKGPGWSPGKPWLGHLEDIPEPRPDEGKYDPQIPVWMKAYAVLHCAAVVAGYMQLIFKYEVLPSFTVICSSCFIILSTISFGAIFDGRSWISYLEMARCLLYFVVESVVVSQVQNLPLVTVLSLHAFKLLFLASLFLWLLISPEVIVRIRNVWKLHSQ